eukprot:1152605-Pelagomonas_calceolata.AAC.5
MKAVWVLSHVSPSSVNLWGAVDRGAFRCLGSKPPLPILNPYQAPAGHQWCAVQTVSFLDFSEAMVCHEQHSSKVPWLTAVAATSMPTRAREIMACGKWGNGRGPWVKGKANTSTSQCTYRSHKDQGLWEMGQWEKAKDCNKKARLAYTLSEHPHKHPHM